MVLISAEQMARRLLGRATWPVMLTVGLAAYSLSAWHTVLLLASWGEPWPLQVTGAVAVDGLAVGSVWALYVAGRAHAHTLHVHPVHPERAPDEQVHADPPITLHEVRALGHDLDPAVRIMAGPQPGPPAAVRTANGHAHTRTATALDERTPPDGEDAVWARWEADARTWTWAELGRELGISPAAARGRAGRRTRRAGGAR